MARLTTTLVLIFILVNGSVTAWADSLGATPTASCSVVNPLPKDEGQPSGIIRVESWSAVKLRFDLVFPPQTGFRREKSAFISKDYNFPVAELWSDREINTKNPKTPVTIEITVYKRDETGLSKVHSRLEGLTTSTGISGNKLHRYFKLDIRPKDPTFSLRAKIEEALAYAQKQGWYDQQDLDKYSEYIATFRAQVEKIDHNLFERMENQHRQNPPGTYEIACRYLSNQKGYLHLNLEALPVVIEVIDQGVKILEMFRPRDSLGEAAYTGNSAQIRTLVENGADVDKKFDRPILFKDLTPIMLAAGWGNLESVETLVELGADLSIESEHGRTVMWYALSKPNVVQYLLHSGMHVETESERGLTPLTSAIHKDKNKLETVRLLLEAGADPNAPSNTGKSPLMRAATQGYTEVVRILLQYGADVNKTGFDGTALEQANRYQSKNKEMIYLLQQAGGK